MEAPTEPAVRRIVPGRKLTGTTPKKGLVVKRPTEPGVAPDRPLPDAARMLCGKPTLDAPTPSPDVNAERVKARARSTASAASTRVHTEERSDGGNGVRARVELVFSTRLEVASRKIALAHAYKDTALSLPGLGLGEEDTGELYKEILDLQDHLTSIDLSRNNFTDILSTNAVASLRHLTVLNLNKNSLTHVPSALYSTLPLLTTLLLANNHIRHFQPSGESSSVSCSEDCCCASTLTTLDLSCNRFHEFPHIAQFKNLEVLGLSANVLSTLPPALGSDDGYLPSLRRLLLDDNAITAIPAAFQRRAASLEELRLAGNEPLGEEVAVNCDSAADVSSWIQLLQSR